MACPSSRTAVESAFEHSPEKAEVPERLRRPAVRQGVSKKRANAVGQAEDDMTKEEEEGGMVLRDAMCVRYTAESASVKTTSKAPEPTYDLIPPDDLYVIEAEDGKERTFAKVMKRTSWLCKLVTGIGAHKRPLKASQFLDILRELLRAGTEPAVGQATPAVGQTDSQSSATMSVASLGLDDDEDDDQPLDGLVPPPARCSRREQKRRRVASTITREVVDLAMPEKKGSQDTFKISVLNRHWRTGGLFIELTPANLHFIVAYMQAELQIEQPVLGVVPAPEAEAEADQITWCPMSSQFRARQVSACGKKLLKVKTWFVARKPLRTFAERAKKKKEEALRELRKEMEQ
jgi:hypothetical protein